MAFFEILRLIISLIPLLIQAIKAIEQAIPESGKGTEKLEAIRGMMESSYEASNKLTGSFEQLWPAVQGTIKSLIIAFNNTGIFKK